MRHAKVPKPPCKRGNNADNPVAAGSARNGVVDIRHRKIARQLRSVVNYDVNTADGLDAEAYDNDQSQGHNDALDKIRRTGRQKSAQSRVAYNND